MSDWTAASGWHIRSAAARDDLGRWWERWRDSRRCRLDDTGRGRKGGTTRQPRFEVSRRTASTVVDVHDGGRFEIISNVSGDGTFDDRRPLAWFRFFSRIVRFEPRSECFVSFSRYAGLQNCRCPNLLGRLDAHGADDLISRLVAHAPDARRLLTGQQRRPDRGIPLE
jgi:hypothetical protein